MDEDGLPRRADGSVGWEALLGDPEMQALILRDSQPFWSIAERPSGSTHSQPEAKGRLRQSSDSD